jgi:hypothetical protein
MLLNLEFSPIPITYEGLFHFLLPQGPGTDEPSLEQLRNATRKGRACVVQLMNYRKNGDAFVNYLSVTPIHDSAGVLTHYVGIQSDITELVNHKKAELAAKHAAVQVRARSHQTLIC